MGRGKITLRDIFADLFSFSTPQETSDKRQIPIARSTSKGTKSSGKADNGKSNRQKVSPTKTIVTHPHLGEITVSRTRQFRRISVTVRADGRVRLNIPAGISINAGMEFLASKEEWIARTLTRAKQSRPRIIAPPYRTHTRELEFIPSQNAEKVSAKISQDRIIITFPDSLSSDSEVVQTTSREAILCALRSEAKAYLPGRVEELASQLCMRLGKVTIRATHTRWGSCSSKNDISLSLYLMRLPDHLIDYIIIHELCHTVHKDHSDRFHTLVDSILNGREQQLRNELRRFRPDII